MDTARPPGSLLASLLGCHLDAGGGSPISTCAPRREQSGPSPGYNLSMAGFKLESKFTPQGDQPEAIRQLNEGLERGDKEQVLLGVTGSGKTFSIAKVIEQANRPTLVLSHNKTLA